MFKIISTRVHGILNQAHRHGDYQAGQPVLVRGFNEVVVWADVISPSATIPVDCRLFRSARIRGVGGSKEKQR